MEDIYLPKIAKIVDIRQETPDVKTFVLKFEDEAVQRSFDYKPGQFIEFSVFDEGEAEHDHISKSMRKFGPQIEPAVWVDDRKMI